MRGKKCWKRVTAVLMAFMMLVGLVMTNGITSEAYWYNSEGERYPNVGYRTHVQSKGWERKLTLNGRTSGTVGAGKRLEAIQIIVEPGYGVGVEYRTHIQSKGWEKTWKKDGETSGTSGEAKRLEAIQIRLTGTNKNKYDIYYRVQAQTYGWLGWVKNGAYAGTAGQAKRLEAIQIIIMPKTDYPTDYEGFDGTIGGGFVDMGKNPTTDGSGAVSYMTHVQSYGNQKWVSDGSISGTSGEGKRLEAISIKVNNAQLNNISGGIAYTTHVQTYGWSQGWKYNGAASGTRGEGKRLEAIRIQLTGQLAQYYDVYYRVHAQSYGWLAWAANGAPAGTAGLSKRLEAIQIVIVKKGESFDHAIGNIQSARGEAYIASSTANANPVVAGENNVNIAYRTHVQSFGWQGWKYNGVMSGTSGKAKRLEGINIKLTNKPYSGSIVYTTHVQSIGWQGNENNVNTWFRDGQMAGTSGRAKRLEAIRVALTGEMAEHYDVYYRVHAQTYGWLAWAKNGEAAGTAGLSKRLEGIQIVLVPKGGAAPANNYGGVVTTNKQTYIKK